MSPGSSRGSDVSLRVSVQFAINASVWLRCRVRWQSSARHVVLLHGYGHPRRPRLDWRSCHHAHRRCCCRARCCRLFAAVAVVAAAVLRLSCPPPAAPSRLRFAAGVRGHARTGRFLRRCHGFAPLAACPPARAACAAAPASRFAVVAPELCQFGFQAVGAIPRLFFQLFELLPRFVNSGV